VSDPTYPAEVRVVPFWEYPDQPTAEQVVQRQHSDALWAMGEAVMFVLWWGVRDFDAGLVERCALCWTGSRHAEAWGQPERGNCPDCFGTGFEGGFRAKVIRPAILSDRTTDENYTSRGQLLTDAITAETTTDIYVRHGDVLIRSDNSRYSCSEMDQVVIRSGFAVADTEGTVSGTIQSANRLPRDDSGYLVPPLHDDQVSAILRTPFVGRHTPPDVTAYEVVRGPLIPDDV
jgi:hypothetical protein